MLDNLITCSQSNVHPELRKGTFAQEDKPTSAHSSPSILICGALSIVLGSLSCEKWKKQKISKSRKAVHQQSPSWRAARWIQVTEASRLRSESLEDVSRAKKLPSDFSTTRWSAQWLRHQSAHRRSFQFKVPLPRIASAAWTLQSVAQRLSCMALSLLDSWESGGWPRVLWFRFSFWFYWWPLRDNLSWLWTDLLGQQRVHEM